MALDYHLIDNCPIDNKQLKNQENKREGQQSMFSGYVIQYEYDMK